MQQVESAIPKLINAEQRPVADYVASHRPKRKLRPNRKTQPELPLELD